MYVIQYNNGYSRISDYNEFQNDAVMIPERIVAVWKIKEKPKYMRSDGNLVCFPKMEGVKMYEEKMK
jgi:hypothetical protein